MAIEDLIPWRRSNSMTSNAPSSEGTPLSISSLQREMNRMFNNIWSSPSLVPRGEEMPGFFYPDVELSETNGNIEISAELPGVSGKDIDVTLSADGSTISIKGEKKLSKEKKEKDYYCAERSYGSFRRTLGLPSSVDPDKVDAKFSNGVLEIRLTKVDDSSTRAKHIEVKES